MNGLSQEGSNRRSRRGWRGRRTRCERPMMTRAKRALRSASSTSPGPPRASPRGPVALPGVERAADSARSLASFLRRFESSSTRAAAPGATCTGDSSSTIREYSRTGSDEVLIRGQRLAIVVARSGGSRGRGRSAPWRRERATGAKPVARPASACEGAAAQRGRDRSEVRNACRHRRSTSSSVSRGSRTPRPA